MSINYKELSKGQVVNHLRTRFIDDGVAIVDNFLEKDVYKKINNLWTHRKYFKAQNKSLPEKSALFARATSDELLSVVFMCFMFRM